MSDCTCDLSRCVPCDAAREAEFRRTFPADGEKEKETPCN